jgi:hypothetical protein
MNPPHARLLKALVLLITGQVLNLGVYQVEPSSYTLNAHIHVDNVNA